jgi:hypothetical protein
MSFYWLASYPKSGSTWLRVLLANYQRGAESPADINSLRENWVVDRELFDEYLGLESADLSAEQLDYYRPSVYARIVASQPSPVFFKIHAAFMRSASGTPIFHSAATAGAVYLVRNPLDVAVSLAHHENLSVDAVIDRMACPTAAVAPPTTAHLPETLSTWSGHALSWIDQADCPVCVVRYEDLIREPVESFATALEFAGIPVDLMRVRRAVDFSRFDRLKAQEDERGFVEKPPGARSFFRSGLADGWRDVLDEAQVRRLTANHGEVMDRIGYSSATISVRKFGAQG